MEHPSCFNPTQQFLFDEFIENYIDARRQSLLNAARSEQAKVIICLMLRLAVTADAISFQQMNQKYFPKTLYERIHNILLTINGLCNCLLPEHDFIIAIADKRFKPNSNIDYTQWRRNIQSEFAKQLRTNMLNWLEENYSDIVSKNPHFKP
ncbi:MAG: hypothetical protein A3F10_05130 [Coxiella sp. RIFCSPHIGHO2_12_FULL_42_15]|nr:MAG: hypothetical protein A3F10_05130 [Coxiella sp. RIFCSPHIGHO2_12_FULL_42_15]